LKPVTGKEQVMSSTKSQDNKAIVDRWFTEFWGKSWNPQIVEELGAPDILLQYLLQAPRRGRADVKTFMIEFQHAVDRGWRWREIQLGRVLAMIIRCETLCARPPRRRFV